MAVGSEIHSPGGASPDLLQDLISQDAPGGTPSLVNSAIYRPSSEVSPETPRTWTCTERSRGPSNSAKMMDCQFPSINSPLRTGTESVWPRTMPLRGDAAFLRSHSERRGSL